ncbi:MAG: hypothetical protein Tsb002_34730 [Wenzhouxiangellaceae bacterium]
MTLRRRFKQIGIGSLILLIITTMTTITDIIDFPAKICQLPGIHQACSWRGWGGVPTTEQVAEFLDAQAQGCDGLRRYLTGTLPTVLRDEADRLLRRKQEIIEQEWVVNDQTLPLYQNRTSKAYHDEATAREATTQAAQQQSDKQCGNAANSLNGKLLNQELKITAIDCDNSTRGWQCSLTGTSHCQLNIPTSVTREQCPGSTIYSD